MSASEPINITALGVEEIVKRFAQKPGDTGSPEVQIALLTKRIDSISGHLKKFVSDLHSERGMMKIISHRKRLLSYLKKESIERYRSLIAVLGLRK